MKFTLSWLKDHLETDASVDAIAEALTDLGLEVEGIEDPLRGCRKISYPIHDKLEADNWLEMASIKRG